MTPLLVALNMQLDHGQVMEKEIELLGKGLGGVEAQLDLAGDTGKTSLVTKPHWISDKVLSKEIGLSHALTYCMCPQTWCKALELQKEVPALRRLTIELTNCSTEWKEYFEVSKLK